jgi:SSS family solute:Na+ symporter
VTPPLYFNPAQEQRVRAADPAAYATLESRYAGAVTSRATAARALAAAHRGSDDAEREAFRASDIAVNAVRTDALKRAQTVTGVPSKDVNYIIPHFVLAELPIGLTGLFIAAVIAAAMSAVAGELASLSSTTVIDFYRRWVKPEADDEHLLKVSRAATGFWGLFACGVATFAATLGSLIEVVNRFGSFFYGSILGVFILAMIKRSRANGAFFGLIAGMATVGAVSFGAPQISFLWHNVIGAVAVVAAGLLISEL